MSASPASAGTRIARSPFTRAVERAADVQQHASGAQSPSQLRQTWQAFRAHRAAYISLCVLGAMITACVVLPFVLVDPNAMDSRILGYAAPSRAHLLGTDSIGRDVLSRLVTAGRISLLIGVTTAAGATLIGAAVGTCAGYLGGRVDSALMWLTNVMLCIPSLPLLMTVAVLVADPRSQVGPLVNAVPEWLRIALVFISLGWMGIARVVRSQVVSLRAQEFVEAARALGASNRRVMFLHVLPNCVSVLAVFATLAVAGAIMGESALSFLGMGIQPPTATWGSMLAEARSLIAILDYWWVVWFPALAIFTTVLCVNFIGDGVRDALDPRRGR